MSRLTETLRVLIALALLAGLGLGDKSFAQTIESPFDNDYSFVDFGTPTGVPGVLGGLTLKAGDPNTLLIGGDANSSNGAIYSIGVTRDAENHITGFTGGATLFATAPQIDGGLVYGDDGVLFFTGYPTNTLGQIKPGSSTPDKIIDLSPLGVASSVGSVNFVAAGFPGAGEMRIASYNGGGFYSADVTPDSAGTFDISNVVLETTTGNGPEGFVYVPSGSPVFTTSSMLFSEFNADVVAAYELDTSGIPIPATRQEFVTGLDGAEGAFIDPLTGDFLFSTFGGGNRVIAVRGFVPEPSSLGILLLSMVGLPFARQRKS